MRRARRALFQDHPGDHGRERCPGFSATAASTPRTWSYTYNARGKLLTANGPRTDVADTTTYTYYPDDDPDLGKRGNVATTTNAAGHLASVTVYDAHGQPLAIIDPNGINIALTYDARQRLKTRTVGAETTTYDYDGVGQLTKVTLPHGSFLSYDYDAAHRLTAITDNLGNRVVYTLDAMGNRTQEQVFDPANQLAQTRSRVFNNLSRLFRELGAQDQTTEYTYDDQGNVITVKDPLDRTTTNQYDALNRLKQVTSPAPISAVTQYAYNGIDALTRVTDPRSLATDYTMDGLGNLTQQASPDTGTTVNTYGYKSGTSMASPMVAGAAALLMSMNFSRVSDDACKDLLRRMAVDLGPDGKDNSFGWGRLSLPRAFFSALRPASAFVGFPNVGALASGSYTSPYGTVAAAVTAVPDGGTVVLNAGTSGQGSYSYPAPITISKAVTLRAFPDRNVLIGQ